MTASLIVAPRFCGPPDVGNGGYTCGLIAGYLDGPADITLRGPPPLATPMVLERDDSGSVRIFHGAALIAEGASWRDHHATQAPEPVSAQEAAAAGAGCRLRTHPEEHPFPRCFACGPGRAPGDGLRILVGRVPGRDLSADLWYPDQALAGPDGNVAPEFLWAALDCAGGVGALWDADPDGPPSVLGRFSARLTGQVRAGDPVIVIGWRLAAEGRVTMAGSALFTEAGQPAGVALATWIRLRAPAGR